MSRQKQLQKFAYLQSSLGRDSRLFPRLGTLCFGCWLSGQTWLPQGEKEQIIQGTGTPPPRGGEGLVPNQQHVYLWWMKQMIHQCAWGTSQVSSPSICSFSSGLLFLRLLSALFLKSEAALWRRLKLPVYPLLCLPFHSQTPHPRYQQPSPSKLTPAASSLCTPSRGKRHNVPVMAIGLLRTQRLVHTVSLNSHNRPFWRHNLWHSSIIRKPNPA